MYQKFIKFKRVNRKKIKNSKNCVEVYAELPVSEQVCPCCGSYTSKIHDHYTQKIKDIPIQFKPTTIFLKKIRYECKNCDKSFYLHTGFISKLLPYLSVTNSSLPRVLCLDEFKGNSGKYKYQVTLLDGETHKIIDILECIHKHFFVIILRNFLQNSLIM